MFLKAVLPAFMNKLKLTLLMHQLFLPATYTASDIGRATTGAALGLLAKAYLYEGKYAQVLTTITS